MGRIVSTLTSKATTNVVFTADLASVLRAMAIEGRGIAWLPQSLIADDLAGGRLVHAAATASRIAVDVRLYRTDATVAASAEAFWATVAKT